MSDARLQQNILQKTVSKCVWDVSRDGIFRPTWVEIDPKAVSRNVKNIKKHLKPQTAMMAVVKANAYGHDANWVAVAALKAGVTSLGVSSIEEGIALRKHDIKCEILILGSMFPLENYSVAAKYGLTPTISSARGLEELANTARKLKKRLEFHLKLDTGMGRIGVSSYGASRLLDEVARTKEVEMSGLYTHFAVAGTDKIYTGQQLKKFETAVKYAKKLGLRFTAHAANSAAILRYKNAHFDMVRPGIMIYGMYPFFGARKKIDLLPVLSWKTRIVFLKRVPKGTCVSYSRTFVSGCSSLIATLPVGYADGYLRKFSNRADVLVRGRRARVVGRVTMDMIMVDVTGIPEAAIGDEVVLIGSQGNDKIRAEELANIAGTINYEITCGISYRVPRVLV
jgi:alanine racemase